MAVLSTLLSISTAASAKSYNVAFTRRVGKFRGLDGPKLRGGTSLIYIHTIDPATAVA